MDLLRLRKYLRPYIFLIVLVIILLFGQGMADLMLPELMSDIVNVGIQKSGIEHSAPDALSKSAYDMLISFSDDDNARIISLSYKPSDINADPQLKERYPKADEIYVLN